MSALPIRFLRDIRLVPIVLVAIVALFALKTLGLVLDGGYLFDRVPMQVTDERDVTGSVPAPGSPAAGASAPVVRQRSWAQEMLNYPDVTGAIQTPESPAKDAPATEKPQPTAKNPSEPPRIPDGTLISIDTDRPLSPAERSILESLQKRHTELEARAHELDMREDLVKAEEKRLEARIAELKDLEAHIDAEPGQKDEAETARFKNVVTMYENMKPKDAAKIFDGLDIKVLLDVAKAFNPRRLSDILALMQPENAQRLTTELASRSNTPDEPVAADLPKIQGKPTPN
jgi:flagellar motility protein MotE (MotC chaperone)